MPNNTLVVHDSEYSMTKNYREGALAFRRSVPWSCNPHRHGSQAHQDWDYGHVHDSAGEHFRFGLDLLKAPLKGSRFEMDEKVPRIEGGDVDPSWHAQQVKELTRVAETML